MFDMRVYPDGTGTEFSPVQVDTMTLDGEKAMVILQEQLDYRSGYAVGNFYLQKTDGAGRMEQWAAATRKKIVPEQEMEYRPTFMTKRYFYKLKSEFDGKGRDQPVISSARTSRPSWAESFSRA